MTRIITLSGARSSGKSTYSLFLGNLLSNVSVKHIADIERNKLAKEMPGVDWFDRTPGFKDTVNPDLGGKTPREVIISRMQTETGKHRGIYAAKLMRVLEAELKGKKDTTIVIDDVHRLAELDQVKLACTLNGWEHIHLHVAGGSVQEDDCVELSNEAAWTVIGPTAAPTRPAANLNS